MDPSAKLTINSPISPVSPSPSAGDQSGTGGDAPRDESAKYRLVIEETGKAGRFVYKTVDRLTGEVVRQLPRERLVEMLESGAYSSGAVIDTNA